jgi:murein DD-endopeptidase MepM/ murein hydrolase activator NlpD
MTRVAAGIVALTTLGILVAGPVGADTKAELSAARAKLAALRDRIQAETRIIERLQQEANAIAEKVSAVQTKIAIAGDRLETLGRETAQAESELRGLQEQLDARARAAYESGPGNALELLLGSSSFAEFSDRLEFIDRAQQSDQDLVVLVDNRKSALLAKQTEVKELQARLDADRRELVSRQNVLQAKLADAQRALRSLDQDRAEAEALVKKLTDRRIREIEAAKLAAAQAQHSHDDSDGGNPPGPPGSGPLLACPVDQPRGYSNDFGVPRPGGRRHQGIDIFAPRGTPIRAPFPGTAVDASNRTGGLSVKVLGSRGFVYNAHLSAIGRLGSVSTGTVIGYVGNSGNARGTPPHDHFEWHPGNGGAVNPYRYLNQAC